jgi:septum formation protein
VATPQIHLASASPRRSDILSSLGIAHSFAGVDIDEKAAKNEIASDLVLRLAREKALAAERTDYADLPVLAADTVVVVDTKIFGKPTDEDHAVAMLLALAGRTHRVITAVAVRWEERLETAISTTAVVFRDIHPDQAVAYWQSGEPVDKAGGYAIQGLGGMFVTGIEGSYSGVVGLPVFETVKLLEVAGIRALPALART